MSEKLLESEFFTIDLRSLFGNADNEENSAEGDTSSKPEDKVTKDAKTTKKEKPVEDTKVKDLKKISDWKEELSTRLAANQERDPDAQLPRAQVEEEFWNDFFTVEGFDAEIIKILQGLDLFKKDTKILGFEVETNPILNFFKLEYVQTDLLKTNLITNETYKAIHNAKAKKYIADSEFRTEKNNYNILYCKDLYASRTASDIEAYLKLQKLNLPTNVDYYDKDRKNRNISIFLTVGNKSVMQKGAKLKKLKEVEKLLGKTGITMPSADSTAGDDATTGTGKAGKHLSRQALVSVVDSLLKDKQYAGAQAQAALQFISMTTNNEDAKKALKTNVFKNTSAEALMDATVRISKAFSSLKMSDAEAGQFVELLLSSLSNG